MIVGDWLMVLYEDGLDGTYYRGQIVDKTKAHISIFYEDNVLQVSVVCCCAFLSFSRKNISLQTDTNSSWQKVAIYKIPKPGQPLARAPPEEEEELSVSEQF